MKRTLRVRENPILSIVGGILCLAFVGIGLFLAIPAFGPFGVLWTLMAAVGAWTNLYNAFSEHGIADQIVEIEDPPSPRRESAPPAARLRTLDELHSQGLITDAEREARRQEILREI